MPVPTRAMVSLLGRRHNQMSAAFYEGLRNAGFLYDFGEDGGGFITRGMQDPSGFYIDTGASELIINGHVAVRSGVSVIPRICRVDSTISSRS